MKKAYMYGAIAVVVIAAVAIYFVVRGQQNNNSMGPMDMNTSKSSKPVASDSVTIQNFAFGPADISVKVGTKVTWTNKDSAAHTVTETDGQDGPQSSDLSPDATYSFTFTKAGTYHYHCAIHPSMTGTVTVS